MTVSVSYKWHIVMFHSDDIWDSEEAARADAIRYAKKFHFDEARIQIYKTTIEVF